MKGSLKRIAIAALVGGLVAAPAFAQDQAPEQAPGQHHGWRHGNPEARIEHMVNRMFSSVNASEAQKTQAGAIVRQAAADVRPLEQQLRDGSRAALQLLAAPAIDRNALEAQRAQQASLREQISKRRTQALADLAEVLTPDQRAALAKRMSEHSQRHRAS